MSTARPPSPNGQPSDTPGASVRNLLYDDPDPRRTSQLHELLRTLWSGKWIVLGVAALVVLGAAIYTYSIPTQYRTSSLLLVDRTSESSVLSEFSRGRSSPFSQQSQTLQNELLILRQSETIANRVAEQLQEMETHPETGAPLHILRGPDGTRRSNAQVVRRVQAAINAQPSGEQTQGIYIWATSHDASEAALIANLYAEAYIERAREKSREDLRASRRFLEEQADTLQAQVRAAEERLQEYMQRANAVSLDQESGRVVQQISELEAQRAQLRIELDMKQASLDAQRQELEQIEPKLAERISSSLEERLTQVQQEKAELESRIEQVERQNATLESGSAAARELQRMKRRAERLDHRADSLAGRYVEEALSAGGVATGAGEDRPQGVAYVAQQRRELAQKRVEINGLEARIDAIEQRLQEHRQQLQDIPSRSMTMAQLQRERRSAEQIYSFVQEKLHEARIAEQSELGYAEVVRPAGPGRPVSPDTQRNLMLALLLGLGLGGGLVVLREQLDTRISQPDDLREHGHHVLGVVPSMVSLIDSEFDGQERIEVDGQNISTLLAMVVSPVSAAAEAYRRLRTNLRFAKPDDNVQTLLISSAGKGDGKTTTCANLGVALASAGKRTIIVDADLRRPRMHEMFAVDRKPGLSQVLYDDGPDLDAFRTNIDGLSLIPAGETVPNPSELLGSERMGELLERLEAHYDYVLLDTPPILLFSDALGLASRCDGTLLVAEAGTTDGRAFDHAVDLVVDVGGDLLGGVLNQYEASSFLEPYDYNYGYAYSYERLYDYYQEEAEPTTSKLRAWWNG